MKTTYLAISLLAFSLTSARLTVREGVGDQDQANYGELSKARIERSPPSPPPPTPPPPPPPPINPLPDEKDGVAPDGTLINPTPVSSTDPQSCWTKPLDPPVLGTDSNIDSGLCQACVIQNGTGSASTVAPFYEIWVRDNSNHAIGGAGPDLLAPLDASLDGPTSLNFTTGAKLFNMWSLLDSEDPDHSVLNMGWGAAWPPDPEDKGIMQFASKSGSGNLCNSSGGAENGAIVYFQCKFHC